MSYVRDDDDDYYRHHLIYCIARFLLPDCEVARTRVLYYCNILLCTYVRVCINTFSSYLGYLLIYLCFFFCWLSRRRPVDEKHAPWHHHHHHHGYIQLRARFLHCVAGVGLLRSVLFAAAADVYLTTSLFCLWLRYFSTNNCLI